jgi:hypothetical protein
VDAATRRSHRPADAGQHRLRQEGRLLGEQVIGRIRVDTTTNFRREVTLMRMIKLLWRFGKLMLANTTPKDDCYK